MLTRTLQKKKLKIQWKITTRVFSWISFLPKWYYHCLKWNFKVFNHFACIFGFQPHFSQVLIVLAIRTQLLTTIFLRAAWPTLKCTFWTLSRHRQSTQMHPTIRYNCMLISDRIILGLCFVPRFKRFRG